MTRGAVVPHAPLLLPPLASPEIEAAAVRIRDALSRLHVDDVDVVVILSPHGDRSGVYPALTGSLREHGVDGVRLELPTDGEAALALAELWGRPLLDHEIDHGVLVPASLIAPGGPLVVGAALRGPSGRSRAEICAEAAAFADALRRAPHGRAAFLASANTSPALSARAPMAALPEAIAAERGFLEALEGQPSLLDGRLVALHRDGRSCGLGPLAAYVGLFPGAPSRILAYERPVGVGYVVAEVSA